MNRKEARKLEEAALEEYEKATDMAYEGYMKKLAKIGKRERGKK